MKVLVCTVNYRTDEALRRFLSSVTKAAAMAASAASVSVLVVDNSMRGDAERSEFCEQVGGAFNGCDVVFPPGNLGYFGVVPLAQEWLARSPASVVIFCNADVSLAEDFFVELARCEGTDAAVVAPAIISEFGAGFDQNPKHVARISSAKLRTLRFIYSNAVTFLLQQFLGYVKERARDRGGDRRSAAQSTNSGEIYAPHGALFIFADPAFFAGLPRHEPFLFGEELFVAEEAMRAGKSIWYRPSIKVFDSRHASISVLGLKRRRQLMKASIDFILRRYY